MATDRLTNLAGSGAPQVDRLTRLSGAALTVAVDRITGVGGYATSYATDRVTRLGGSTGSLLVDRITRLRGAITSSAMTVSAGSDRTVEPLEVVLIDVVTTGSPDTVTVTCDPPFGVAFPGNSGLSNPAPGVWQYVAPATLTGAVLTFTATATRAGATTVTDVAVHTIHRHTVWTYNTAGALVPRLLRGT